MAQVDLDDETRDLLVNALKEHITHTRRELANKNLYNVQDLGLQTSLHQAAELLERLDEPTPLRSNTDAANATLLIKALATYVEAPHVMMSLSNTPSFNMDAFLDRCKRVYDALCTLVDRPHISGISSGLLTPKSLMEGVPIGGHADQTTLLRTIMERFNELTDADVAAIPEPLHTMICDVASILYDLLGSPFMTPALLHRFATDDTPTLEILAAPAAFTPGWETGISATALRYVHSRLSGLLSDG